jgi:hypothetical protein
LIPLREVKYLREPYGEYFTRAIQPAIDGLRQGK